jgi:hypothetical protein
MTKIDEELDIRFITQELRTLRFISDVLLTKYQRFMIPHCKRNILNPGVTKYMAKKLEEPMELKSSLAQTIEDSLTTKLDRRILKNIDAGTDHITELNQKLRAISKNKQSTFTKKQNAEAIISNIKLTRRTGSPDRNNSKPPPFKPKTDTKTFNTERDKLVLSK